MVSHKNNRWLVWCYDPTVKRKRYVGTFKTEGEARDAEVKQKALLTGRAKDGRRCPGCKQYFYPQDEWQKRCSPRCETLIKRRERRRRQRRTDDHWVYTALNSDGEVIYVGITSTGLRRHREHGREMAWWPEVSVLLIDHYATRDDALMGEAAGIDKHQPPYNTHGIDRAEI